MMAARNLQQPGHLDKLVVRLPNAVDNIDEDGKKGSEKNEIDFGHFAYPEP